jgi:hypothetical protein
MTQQFLLPCACGQKLRVSNAQAGEQVSCVCGSRLNVPTLRGIRQLEVVPAEANVRAAPGWSRVQGAMFAAGLLAAAIGLGMIAYSGFQYAQIRHSHYGDLTQDRSADLVKAMSENVEKLTILQMREVWAEEIIKEGLGDAHRPIWIAAKERLAQLSRQAIAGVVTMIVGVVASLAAVLICKTR